MRRSGQRRGPLPSRSHPNAVNLAGANVLARYWSMPNVPGRCVGGAGVRERKLGANGPKKHESEIALAQSPKAR